MMATDTVRETRDMNLHVHCWSYEMSLYVVCVKIIIMVSSTMSAKPTQGCRANDDKDLLLYVSSYIFWFWNMVVMYFFVILKIYGFYVWCKTCEFKILREGAFLQVKKRVAKPHTFSHLIYAVHWQVGSSGNTSELYSADTYLESQLAYWLSWLRVFLFSPLQPTRCQVDTWNYAVTTFRTLWFVIHELYCHSTHIVLWS